MIADRKKALGQHFTPVPVAQLVGALALTGETEKVIDPTCGDGQFLTEAAKLVPDGAPCEVVGVEIDGNHAVTATQNLKALGGRMSSHVISDDVFLAAAGVGRGGRQRLSNFDAVIGNPPYVRYQSLLEGTEERGGSPALLAPKSDARSVIRSCLLSSSLSTRPRNLDELLGVTEAWKATRDATDVENPVDRDWVRLVTNYSGLADLALPMWLLTRTLCRPNGVVALVTTESIYNRRYGRLLRYFMLRFMEPIVVIKQDGGGWFPNAQVRAAIVMVRRRTDTAAATTLRERAESTGAKVPHVALAATANLADPSTLTDLCRRLNLDPEMPNQNVALHIAAAMSAGRRLPGGWAVRMESEQDLIHRLIDELGGPDGELLTALEGPRVASAGRKTAVPAQIHNQRFYRGALGGVLAATARFVTLASQGVDVHQGLRTGCNRFFYLSGTPAGASVWAENAEDLRHSGDPRTSARTLVDLPDVGLTGIPMGYLRPVIKTRSQARRWRDHGEPPTTFVLLARSGGRQEDILALQHLPDDWLRNWRREGLHRLPAALDNYISLAESWEIAGANGPTRVFDLSAVAPNVRTPRVQVAKEPNQRSEAPRWWYTLTLKERHTAPVLVSRVNSGPVEAFANHDRVGFVVDANFSTLIPSTTWTAAHLVAYLNTGLAAIWLEEHATPMGGGALKVEAAHLRELPVPVLPADAMRELGRIGLRITSHADLAFEDLRRLANAVVIGEVVPPNRVEAAEAALEREVAARVAARSPRPVSR